MRNPPLSSYLKLFFLCVLPSTLPEPVCSLLKSSLPPPLPEFLPFSIVLPDPPMIPSRLILSFCLCTLSHLFHWWKVSTLSTPTPQTQTSAILSPLLHPFLLPFLAGPHLPRQICLSSPFIPTRSAHCVQSLFF